MNRMALLALTPLLLGAVVYNTPTLRLVCDPYEMSISAFEVQICAEPTFSQPLTVLVEDEWAPGEVPTALVHEAFAPLPDGVYYLRARVRSEALVWSEWGGTLEAVKDWTPPPPPTGCWLLKGDS